MNDEVIHQPALRTNTQQGQNPEPRRQYPPQQPQSQVYQPNPQSQQPPPHPSQVPSGAQPGMTPIQEDPSTLRMPPPSPETAVFQPETINLSHTTLDRLQPLMETPVWHTFLAIVTYAQLCDELESEEGARMSDRYRSSMLAPFIGFGPDHVWQALGRDIKMTMLRIMARWFRDPEYRKQNGSLTWQVIDWLAPGFCQMTKGVEAHDKCIDLLQELKKDFV